MVGTITIDLMEV